MPEENSKLVQMIATIRALDDSANEGVQLIAGRGNVALDLSAEEIEEHIRPLLQARKSSVGLKLAGQPKQPSQLIVASKSGAADDGKTTAKDSWRY